MYEQLADLGDKRIAAMDAAGIDMQVLSLNDPGAEQSEADEALAVARDANDALAAAVRKHPTRLAGFATLPTRRPTRPRRSSSAACAGRLQGRADQRPQSRPLSRRRILLADPRMRGSARGADLSASGAAAEAGDGRLLWRLPAGGDLLLAGPGWGWHIETASTSCA